jgi:hypothetical protein
MGALYAFNNISIIYFSQFFFFFKYVVVYGLTSCQMAKFCSLCCFMNPSQHVGNLGPRLQTCSYLMHSFEWPCWDTCEGIWGAVHAYLFGGECDRDKMMQL